MNKANIPLFLTLLGTLLFACNLPNVAKTPFSETLPSLLAPTLGDNELLATIVAATLQALTPPASSTPALTDSHLHATCPLYSHPHRNSFPRHNFRRNLRLPIRQYSQTGHRGVQPREAPLLVASHSRRQHRIFDRWIHLTGQIPNCGL